MDPLETVAFCARKHLLEGDRLSESDLLPSALQLSFHRRVPA